jgi:DNA-binding IclR family transcriptional regulator
MSADPARGTNALQKGLVILDCLAAAGGRLTFTELVEATGYPKGTLHRILAALLDHGSVRLDRDDNRYRFGWRVIEHARHASAELDVVSIAQGSSTASIPCSARWSISRCRSEERCCARL